MEMLVQVVVAAIGVRFVAAVFGPKGDRGSSGGSAASKRARLDAAGSRADS